MKILELDEAQRLYPGLDISTCDDPRHGSSVDDESVAVIVTTHDIYPVCESCLASIQRARWQAEDDARPRSYDDD